jgi:hypothetical protein
MKELWILNLNIFLFFSSFSCAGQKGIVGNWYTCGPDGYYIEMYVKEAVFYFCTEDNFAPQNYPYKYNSDTLVYFDPYASNESFKTKKVIVSFQTENEMTWNYISTGERWTYHKLNIKLMEFPDSITSQNFIETLNVYEKLKNDTKKRARKMKCPDLRSEEQKRRDSLNRRIDFQF